MLDGPDNDLFSRSGHLQPEQHWAWSLSRLRSGYTRPSLGVTWAGGCGRQASPEGEASSTFSWGVAVVGDVSTSPGGEPSLLQGCACPGGWGLPAAGMCLLRGRGVLLQGGCLLQGSQCQHSQEFRRTFTASQLGLSKG